MHIRIQNQTFIMLPEKALYWKEKHILLVADTHFGKTDTFRKGGIPVPGGSDRQGMQELEALLIRTEARRCIILGDFFHSVMNSGWNAVETWCLQQSKKGIPIELVPGNHDILHASDYAQAGILVHSQNLIIDTIRLQHEPPVESSVEGYTLCGHLHPGVVLTGKGRQQLRLPCFWFSEKTGVLPAFGYFTGLSEVRPAQGDNVFVTTQVRNRPYEKGTIIRLKE